MFQKIYTDNDLLQPYEIPLSKAAALLRQSLHEDSQGITEKQLAAALTTAIRQGELTPKRGTLTAYPWPAPEPILDAEDVKAWALASGLSLYAGGASRFENHLLNEGDLNHDLIHYRADRLRAMRTLADVGFHPRFDVDDTDLLLDTDPNDPPLDKDYTDPRLDKDDTGPHRLYGALVLALEENNRLKREMAQGEREPDPRHRSTLLRIIGALAALAGIENSMAPKTAAHAINARLESMGQKGMKPETITRVITDARRLANESRG